MKNDERIPGEFVASVTVSEVLVSAGVQLIHWANDIAFTDAVFGENWAAETANRMATISEILNLVYQSLPRRSLDAVIVLPPGVVGVIAINPNARKEAEEPQSDDGSSSEQNGGDASSISDLPF